MNDNRYSPVFDKRSLHKANNVTRQVLSRRVLLKDLSLNRSKRAKLSDISAGGEKIVLRISEVKELKAPHTCGWINDAYRLVLITIMTTRFAPTIANVNVIIKNACITSRAPRFERNVDEFPLSQLLFLSRGATRIVILWSITLLWGWVEEKVKSRLLHLVDWIIF